jgi:hypothetical protein
VRKKGLPMSDAAYLDQAAAWSKDLTRMKARGQVTQKRDASDRT